MRPPLRHPPPSASAAERRPGRLTAALILTAFLPLKALSPAALGAQVTTLEEPVDSSAIVRSSPVVNRTEIGTWVQYVPAIPQGILILAHGYPWPDDSRTAEQLEEHAARYVVRWRGFADRHGLILLVPAFGSGDFAGYREMFGKRMDADAFIITLADRYGRALIPGYDGRFFLYGHSAGGQFASRVLVAHPDRLAGVVLSAPGTYPFPDTTIPWPYGAGPVRRDTLSGTAATGKPREAVTGALFRPNRAGWAAAARSVPVRIVIGLDDTEPRSERPAQVGTTRIDHAVGWARLMNGLSGVDPGAGIGIRFVPGIGHDPVALTPAAQEAFDMMRSGAGRRETVLDSIAWVLDDASGVPGAPRPDERSRSIARRVRAAGIAFFVRDQGSGVPIVLIPGGPGNTQQSFHPYFDRAADFARVITYDPRGTGQSDWNPGPGGYSAGQAVEDLEALRVALGIDRWVVLGWSFGGLLAQRYALAHGEHVAGLVLLSTSLAMQVDVGESAGRRYLSPVERDRIAEVYREGVETVVPVHSDRVDLTTVRRLVYNAYRNGEWKRQFFFHPSPERMAQVAWWEWVQDRNYTAQVASTGFAQDLTDAFLEWTVPTLIVEGRWDPEWGPQKPRVLQEQFPNAGVHVIGGASHNAFAEQPDAFFGLLREFLRTVSPP